jgi:hypothetical protein
VSNVDEIDFDPIFRVADSAEIPGPAAIRAWGERKRRATHLVTAGGAVLLLAAVAFPVAAVVNGENGDRTASRIPAHSLTLPATATTSPAASSTSEIAPRSGSTSPKPTATTTPESKTPPASQPTAATRPTTATQPTVILAPTGAVPTPTTQPTPTTEPTPPATGPGTASLAYSGVLSGELDDATSYCQPYPDGQSQITVNGTLNGTPWVLYIQSYDGQSAVAQVLTGQAGGATGLVGQGYAVTATYPAAVSGVTQLNWGQGATLDVQLTSRSGQDPAGDVEVDGTVACG